MLLNVIAISSTISFIFLPIELITNWSLSASLTGLPRTEAYRPQIYATANLTLSFGIGSLHLVVACTMTRTSLVDGGGFNTGRQYYWL